MFFKFSIYVALSMFFHFLWIIFPPNILGNFKHEPQVLGCVAVIYWMVQVFRFISWLGVSAGEKLYH